jgi:hypothetical protein
MFSSTRPVSQGGRSLILRTVTARMSGAPPRLHLTRLVALNRISAPLSHASRVRAADYRAFKSYFWLSRKVVRSFSWTGLGVAIVAGIAGIVSPHVWAGYRLGPPTPCPIPPVDDPFVAEIQAFCSQSWDMQTDQTQRMTGAVHRLKECEWLGRSQRHQNGTEVLGAMQGLVRLGSLPLRGDSAVQYHALLSLNKLLSADLSECEPAAGLIDVEKHLHNLLIGEMVPLLKREAARAYSRVIGRLAECTPSQLGKAQRMEIVSRAAEMRRVAHSPICALEPWVQYDLLSASHVALALLHPALPLSSVVKLSQNLSSLHRKGQNLGANYWTLFDREIKKLLVEKPTEEEKAPIFERLLCLSRLFDQIDLTNPELVGEFINQVQRNFRGSTSPREADRDLWGYYSDAGEWRLVDLCATRLLVEIAQSELTSAEMKERAVAVLRSTYFQSALADPVRNYLDSVADELRLFRNRYQQLARKELTEIQVVFVQQSNLQLMEKTRKENIEILKPYLRESVKGSAASLFKNCPIFVGRARELTTLDRLFARQSVVEIVGGSGAGKTQLALGYVMEYSNRYSRAYHLQCSDSVTFDRELRKLAQELQVPDDRLPTNDLCLKLRAALEESSCPFFLILDNVEIIKDVAEPLKELIPRRGGQTALILRGRGVPAAFLAEPIPSVSVEPWLDEASGVRLFQAVTKFLQQQQPARQQTYSEDREQMEVALTLLGYHPLAISWLAYYMFNSEGGWAEVIEGLENRGLGFTNEVRQSFDSDKAVRVSFDLLMEELKKVDETAGSRLYPLLRLCAWMPAENIDPESVLEIEALVTAYPSINPELSAAEFNQQWKDAAGEIYSREQISQFEALQHKYRLLQSGEEGYCMDPILRKRLRRETSGADLEVVHKAVDVFLLRVMVAYKTLATTMKTKWSDNRPETQALLRREIEQVRADPAVHHVLTFVDRLHLERTQKWPLKLPKWVFSEYEKTVKEFKTTWEELKSKAYPSSTSGS